MKLTITTDGINAYAQADGEAIGQIYVPDIDLHWADGVYVKIAGINGVETKEEFRGQGVAAQMMEMAKKQAFKNGYACSALTASLGRINIPRSIARRLYSRAGYTTIFRPGRFSKRLDSSRHPVAEGFQIRGYRDEDKEALMRLFEETYRPYFGFRKKTVERWDDLREEILNQDPDCIWIAEDENGIQGWTGYCHQWVGRCSELWVRASQKREIVGQALLSLHEEHLLSMNVRDAHFWVSPQDDFMADLLIRHGYTYADMRVFMLHILNLPKLLTALLPLFNRRLTEGASWRGVLKFTTPLHRALLQVDKKVEVKQSDGFDIEVLTDERSLARILCGALHPGEAYDEDLLTVKPKMTSEIGSLLGTLFPETPHFHPADDLW